MDAAQVEARKFRVSKSDSLGGFAGVEPALSATGGFEY